MKESDRIAELTVTSWAGGVSVGWQYFDTGTRMSNETEMLAMVRLRCEHLRGRLDGSAAQLVLNIHRVPGELGVAGSPGFGFEQRQSQNSLERDLSLNELLDADILHLDPN